MFVVLSGHATFYGPGGEARELGRNEGLMLPAGSLYYFHASGGEPLVLLRVGARASEGPIDARVGADGHAPPLDELVRGLGLALHQGRGHVRS